MNIDIDRSLVISVCMGLGLSAACGFRVFVPLLVLSIASIWGYVPLGPGFEWIGTYPALTAFAVATALEIAGYYIPAVDHALDTIAAPVAVLAGVVMTASLLGRQDPFLKWSIAVIAGGGAAAVVQAGTMSLRALSTTATAGLGNFIVTTLEIVAALTLAIFALLIPVIVVVGLLVAAVLFLLRRGRRIRMQRDPSLRSG